MKKRALFAAILAVLLSVSFLSCTQSGAADKPYVAVIVKSTESDFFHRVRDGVESAAMEYNVHVTFEGPANEEDYEAQNEMIRRAAENGADVIVLSAIDYEQSSDTVNGVIRRGVRVITIDSDISSDLVPLFIGTDNREAGKAAAAAAVRGFAEGGKIYIGIVNYRTETENGREREAGFRAAVAKMENVRIVDVVTAESNEASATETALSLLSRYPHINVLVGLNEWMTLGVGNAIRKTGATHTRGVGFDANLTSIAMLEGGEMDALLVQNPFAIGYLGVQRAVTETAADNEKKKVYTAMTVVTRENLYDEDIQKLLFRFHG